MNNLKIWGIGIMGDDGTKHSALFQVFEFLGEVWMSLIQDWRFFAALSAVFAALTAVFGKIGVTHINSNFATLIRTVVILLVCAIFVTFRQEWMRFENIPAKSIFFLILSGIATGFSWLCYYRALQLGPVSRVASVDKLSVVLVVIFGVIFLGEAFSWKVGVGALMILTGVIFLAV